MFQLRQLGVAVQRPSPVLRSREAIGSNLGRKQDIGASVTFSPSYEKILTCFTYLSGTNPKQETRKLLLRLSWFSSAPGRHLPEKLYNLLGNALLRHRTTFLEHCPLYGQKTGNASEAVPASIFRNMDKLPVALLNGPTQYVSFCSSRR